jgi:hypothetical protein
MPAEGEIAAQLPEATAAYIDAAQFRRDGGRDEDKHQPGQNHHCTGVKPPDDQGKAAQNLQPRQVKGEARAERPRDDVIVLDVFRIGSRAFTTPA